MLAIHEHIKLGRRINDKKSLKLFQNVIYYIDETLDERQKQRVSDGAMIDAGNDTKLAPVADQHSDQQWRHILRPAAAATTQPVCFQGNQDARCTLCHGKSLPSSEFAWKPH